MACATAANDTLTIAKAAAITRTPASMAPTSEPTDFSGNVTSRGKPEAIVPRSCRPFGFSNFCRCFNKVTPLRRGPARICAGAVAGYLRGVARRSQSSQNAPDATKVQHAMYGMVNRTGLRGPDRHPVVAHVGRRAH